MLREWRESGDLRRGALRDKRTVPEAHLKRHSEREVCKHGEDHQDVPREPAGAIRIKKARTAFCSLPSHTIKGLASLLGAPRLLPTYSHLRARIDVDVALHEEVGSGAVAATTVHLTTQSCGRRSSLG